MPRWRAGKRRKSGTNDAALAAAKAASDAAVANGDPNPAPVGRPPTQEAGAAIQLLSPTQELAGAATAIVPELNNRGGHRKDASMEYLAGKIAGLDDDDAAALQEQLRLAQGISGPCCA